MNAYELEQGPGGAKTWAATAALFASWVGGSANMASMEASYGELIDKGAYACAS